MAGVRKEVNPFVDGMIDSYIEQYRRSSGTIEFDSLESIRHTFIPVAAATARENRRLFAPRVGAQWRSFSSNLLAPGPLSREVRWEAAARCRRVQLGMRTYLSSARGPSGGSGARRRSCGTPMFPRT
jgi:hypothetical protein